MLKRSLQVLFVALFSAVVGVVSTQSASALEPTVYNQPGDHHVNGRYWKTSCEMYSTNVVRCSTDIWATKVVAHNGTYYNHNGWVFNNLTYLPSGESQWKGNPLAMNREWTAKDGRKWMTECNNAKTGQGACRSYTWSNAVVQQGKKFAKESVWKFNNIVQFSSKAAPAQTTILPKSAAVANMPVEKAFKAPAAAAASSGKGLNLAREGMWDRIARCESGNNWSINTGNGHYGGLQFKVATWRSVGGAEFAAYPHHASRAQQITVANRLYAQRGTQPWSCA